MIPVTLHTTRSAVAEETRDAPCVNFSYKRLLWLTCSVLTLLVEPLNVQSFIMIVIRGVQREAQLLLHNSMANVT